MVSRLALPALLLLGLSPLASQEPRRSSALVVPVEDVIDIRTVALVRRGLAEARSRGVGRVVLDINTPGGLLPSTEEIVAILSLLHAEKIETIAYARHNAFSAGAIVALACRRIFMAEDAVIGAATPVFLGGDASSIPEEHRLKLLSAVRADVRRIAEHHGPEIALLAEAMVDPRLSLVRVRYRDKDGLSKREVMPEETLRGLREQKLEISEEEPITSRPLTLSARQAFDLRLCDGIAGSMEDLMRELGVVPEDVERLSATWSEELAGFLHGIRLFLLIGGIVMAVIAVKTPGTGVPEALAALCFLLFFAGQWLVGLAAVTEVLLFVGGIGLILVEVFLVPGILVAGVAGFLLVVAALFLSLQPFVLPQTGLEGDVMLQNLINLTITIVAVCVVASLLSRLLPRIPFFNRLLLEASPSAAATGAATSAAQASPLLGQRFRALTDLRPAGKIDVGGSPLDVVTAGAYVERGTVVEVVQVTGNRVVVEASRRDSGQVALAWILFLLFVGLLAMVAEVFFPSFGVLSVVSAVLTVAGVFLGFQHGTEVGLTLLAAVAVLAPVAVIAAFRVLPRTPFGKRLILAGPTFEPSPGDVRDRGLDAFVGRQGQALTPLRPSGTIEIDGRRLDAITRGEIVDAGRAVNVLRVELAQLVVAAAEPAGASVEKP